MATFGTIGGFGPKPISGTNNQPTTGTNVGTNDPTSIGMSVPIGCLDSRLGSNIFTKEYISYLSSGSTPQPGMSFGDVQTDKFHSRYGFMPAVLDQDMQSGGFIDPSVLTSLRTNGVDRFRKSLTTDKNEKNAQGITSFPNTKNNSNGSATLGSAAGILAEDFSCSHISSLNRSIYEPSIGVTMGGIGGASIYALRTNINTEISDIATKNSAAATNNLNTTSGVGFGNYNVVDNTQKNSTAATNIHSYIKHVLPRFLRDLNLYQHISIIQSTQLLAAMVKEGPVNVARTIVSLYNRKNISCPFRYAFYNYFDPSDPRCIIGEFSETGSTNTNMGNGPTTTGFGVSPQKTGFGGFGGTNSNFGTNTNINNISNQSTSPVEWFKKIVLSPTGALTFPDEPPPGWGKNMWNLALANNPDPNRMVPTLACTFTDLRIRQMTQKYEMCVAQQNITKIKERLAKLSERKKLFMETCKMVRYTQASIQERLISLTCAVQNANLEAVPSSVQIGNEVEKIIYSHVFPTQDNFVRIKLKLNENKKLDTGVNSLVKDIATEDRAVIKKHLKEQKDILMSIVKRIEQHQ